MVQTEALCVRPAEAARMLSLSKGTLYALITAGKIRSIRQGRAVLVPVAELKRYIREGASGAQPAA